MTTIREDLDNLVKSPGWKRLKAWAQSEWSDRLLTHTEQAANTADDVQALNKLRQVIAARRAVEMVLGWPDEQIKRLDAPAPHSAVTLSRGGI